MAAVLGNKSTAPLRVKQTHLAVAKWIDVVSTCTIAQLLLRRTLVLLKQYSPINTFPLSPFCRHTTGTVNPCLTASRSQGAWQQEMSRNTAAGKIKDAAFIKPAEKFMIPEIKPMPVPPKGTG